MKYDIFISYSRKDTKIADRICAALDRVGITYFIDRKGIAGGMEFPAVLADAIAESRIFLLLASENSYESPYTNKEIYFAFNCKCMMLPYIIDGSQLPMRLQFTFADINWRTITEHPVDTVLVADLLQLLGKSAASVKPTKVSGTKIITAGAPGVIKIWNANTGRCIDTFGRDGVRYKTALYSPDGKDILSRAYVVAAAVPEFRILDSKTGDVKAVIPRGEGEVFKGNAVYADGGRKIMISSWARNADAWYLRFYDSNGRYIKTVPLDFGEERSVDFCAVSQDGRLIAFRSYNHAPSIYDTETGRFLVRLGKHDFKAMAFSNDGSRVITGTDDGDVMIWNSRNGLLIDTLKQHMDGYTVEALAYSPDDRLIVSGAYKNIRLWDVDTGKCLKTLYGDEGFEPIDRLSVDSVVFNKTGDRFVVTAGRTAIVMNTSDASLEAVLDGHADSGITAAFSPD